MVIAHIHHFLDTAGQEHFPAWLREAAVRIQHFNGFLSIGQLKDLEHPRECHVQLEFETLESLRLWSESAEHGELLALLDPFQIGRRESKVYEVHWPPVQPDSSEHFEGFPTLHIF